MIKEGAAVIDVGINRVQDPITGKNRLVGDVDFEGKARLRTRSATASSVFSCICGSVVHTLFTQSRSSAKLEVSL